MKTKRYFTQFCFLLGVLLFVVSCKKSDDEEPVPTGYMCNCGDVTWKGVSYPLLDANYVVPIDTISNSRKYYLTADVEGENNSVDITHNVNIEIEIMDVSPAPGMFEGIFGPVNDTVEVRIEDVTISPSGTEIRRYVATEGIITVEPSIFGSQEAISYSLNVKRRLNDGSLVGFPEPMSGSFTVAPEN